MLDRIKNFIENIGNPDERPIDLGHALFLESENNGFLPFNTASVKLKAYNDATKSQRLNNISVQWFRSFEGRNYSIDNIEDSYNFSCEDIGAKIIGVVSDNDRPNVFNSITFGPVCLDPQCRVELETVFKSGRAIFEVQLPYSHLGNDLLLKPPEYKNANKFIIDEIALTPDNITFIHSKGVNTTLSLKLFKFYAVESYPLLVQVRFEDHITELDFLEQRLFVENGNWFNIKFFNRIFRENFLILCKLFAEVKSQTFSNQLAIWESRGAEKGFFTNKMSGLLNAGNSSVGDLLIQLERTRDALSRNVLYTKTVIEERNSLMEYSEGLERDLKATLKDLKDLVVKQRLQSHIDVSKIEKVEGSIIDLDRRKQDNNFSKAEPGNGNTVTQLRLQKLQEDNQKLEKLNKILLKELNGYREKRKEKIRSINQSLNALNRELATQAQNLNIASGPNNQSLDISKYLENINNDPTSKSMAKKSRPQVFDEKANQNYSSKIPLESEIREEKTPKGYKHENNPELEISILITQKAELNQKVLALQRKIDELETTVQRQQLPIDPNFELQFKEIRDLINNCVSRTPFDEEIQSDNQQSQVIEPSLVLTIRKVAKSNQIELLNIENSILSKRATYLFNKLKAQTNNEDFDELNTEAYNGLQTKIDGLRRENERLFEELESIPKTDAESEMLLKKQTAVLKGELERSLAEKEAFKEKAQNSDALEERIRMLEGELAGKERVLQGAVATNRSLAEEINRLQTVINAHEESLNLSSTKE